MAAGVSALGWQLSQSAVAGNGVQGDNMHSRSRRLTSLCRTGALLSAALVTGITAAAQTAPDYSSFTAAQFIPFAPPENDAPLLINTPRLRFVMDGKSYEPKMDTGTTGIMLSASSIPGYTLDGASQLKPGWEFLSSSKLLWAGHWILKEINFQDTGGAIVATATVPVLAVERETFCPNYPEAKSPPTCPGVPSGPPKQEIAYMGVGFGREHDGQPQGTPDHNPLLSITQIGGVPVRPGTMRSGYILTARGVHVGLTAANTSGFAYTSLTLPKNPNGPRDWSQASICVSVDGSACVRGSVLIDTGIEQMYLSLPSDVQVRSVCASDPSVKKVQVNALQDGSRVAVRFPDDQNTIAFYSFIVGDEANPMLPDLVILPRPQPCTLPLPPSNAATFVNTGRHFLRRFDVLFDAEGGKFGLRWTGPAGAPEGGTVASGAVERAAGSTPSSAVID
jgi:hypothetical protein